LNSILRGDTILKVEIDTLIFTAFCLVCDTVLYGSMGILNWQDVSFSNIDPFANLVVSYMTAIQDTVEYSQSPEFVALYFTCLGLLKYRFNRTDPQIAQDLHRAAKCLFDNSTHGFTHFGYFVIGFTLSVCVQVGYIKEVPALRFLLETWPQICSLWLGPLEEKMSTMANNTVYSPTITNHTAPQNPYMVCNPHPPQPIFIPTSSQTTIMTTNSSCIQPTGHSQNVYFEQPQYYYPS